MTEAVGDQTLVPLVREEMVAWERLQERYGALLKLVEVLLGVVPNCDRYLEMWPPAFRTYNVMVPNSLNLPAPIFGVGGAPGEIVGLGMYVSSRDADVVGACRASGLPPAAVVELVTWLAVLQMLHRLSCFYGHVTPAARTPSPAG